MFSPETLLQDIAMEDHSLAFFLRRYVKDHNWACELKHMCQFQKLKLELVSEALSGILNPETVRVEDFDIFSTRELIQFLQDGHDHYLQTVLPELYQLIYNLERSEQSELSPLWKGFITSYSSHLKEHFQEEEERLFPLAFQLENQLLYISNTGLKACQTYLSHFTEGHLDEVQELKTLRKSLLNRPQTVALKALDRLILVLSSFEKDLFLHDLIEEQIVLPRIEGEINRRKILLN